MPFINLQELRETFVTPISNSVHERAEFIVQTIGRERELMASRANRYYTKAVDGVEYTKATVMTYIKPTIVVVESIYGRAQAAREQTALFFENAKKQVDDSAVKFRTNVSLISTEAQNRIIAIPIVQHAQVRFQSLASYIYSTGKQTEERALQVREKVSGMVGSTEVLAWNIASAAKANVKDAVDTIHKKVPVAVSNLSPKGFPEAFNAGREQIFVAATNFSSVLGLDNYLGSLQSSLGLKIPIPVKN